MCLSQQQHLFPFPSRQHQSRKASRKHGGFRTSQGIDERGDFSKTGTEGEDHKPEGKEAPLTHTAVARLRETHLEKKSAKATLSVAVGALFSRGWDGSMG